MAESAHSQTLRFAAFEVDLRAGELRKSGIKIKLQEKPFQILVLLLESPGELVTRDELRDELWPADTFVDFDHSLGTAIAKLRQALGDSAQNPRFVETVSGRGYRFLAPVENVLQAQPATKLGTPRLRRLTLSVATGLVGGALLLAAVLGFNLGGARGWLRRQSNRPIRSLAVLPLENLSGDPAQEYFADGMTDELITTLAQLGNVRVISRTSVMQYKGTKKPLPQIARELQVDAVVEGSVMRSGQRVRIAAQLVDAANDQHLWAQSYERDLGDVLLLQGDVASAIAKEIKINLTPVERARISAAHVVNPEAHIAYLKARYLINSQRSGYGAKKSLEYAHQAVQIDPGDALAYAGLANSYVNVGFLEALPAKEVMPKAKAAAEKALEIDPNLAEAHVVQGMVLAGYDFNWSSAEREFRRAIELNAGSSFAHQEYGEYLVCIGRMDEAIFEIRLAQRLDPLSFWIARDVGKFLYLARQYDQALEALRQAADLNGRSPALYNWMSLAYDKKGMAAESVEMGLKNAATGGMSEHVLGELRNAYKNSGEEGYLKKELELIAREPYGRALLEARLAKKDEAFQSLESAFEERSIWIGYLKVDPGLDGLRPDARFRDLLRRMGFPQ